MEFLDTNYFWVLFLLTVIFIFVYKWLIKNPDAITSKYETMKTIKGNPIDIEKLIMKALKNAGFNKVGLNKEDNRMYALTKFSIYSYSEYIEVSFNHYNFSTDFKFKSKCALPTQIVGWGKNRRNYKKFEKELNKLMPTSPIVNAG